MRWSPALQSRHGRSRRTFATFAAQCGFSKSKASGAMKSFHTVREMGIAYWFDTPYDVQHLITILPKWGKRIHMRFGWEVVIVICLYMLRRQLVIINHFSDNAPSSEILEEGVHVSPLAFSPSFQGIMNGISVWDVESRLKLVPEPQTKIWRAFPPSRRVMW